MDQLERRPGGESCPTHEELKAFAAREVPIPISKTIAQHVDACAECFAFVASLGSEDAGTLRQPLQPRPGLAADLAAKEPAYRSVDSAANTLLATDRSSASRDASSGDLTLPFTMGQ